MFRSRGPKRFEYQPRYYNPDREDLQDRIMLIKGDLESERMYGKMKGQYQQLWGREFRKRSIQLSNRRIVIISGVLVMICYLMLRVAGF